MRENVGGWGCFRLGVNNIIVFLVLVAIYPKLSYAHTGENHDGIYVRVINYNPDTYEYSIQCFPPNKTSASQITPEKFYAIDPVPSHHFNNRSFRSTLNVTTWKLDPTNFEELVHTNAMYHMYCEVQNFSAPAGQQNLASEFHVDLRTTHNQNAPNIYVTDSKGPRATLKCDPPPSVKDYSMSWKLRSRGGITSFPGLDNKRIVNITAPKASAGWDVVCGVTDKRTGKFYHWDMPIEFFEEGPAYIPTIEGCIPEQPCYQVSPDGIVPNGGLIVNVSFNNAPAQADIYINEVFKGITNSNGMLTINNIIPGIYNLVIKKAGLEELSTLIPIAAGKQLYRSHILSSTTTAESSPSCFNSVAAIPANCTSGTIIQDTASGACRTINCANGGSSMKILACDKPDGSIPQYFEMYKQSQVGNAVSEICLGNICIKENGYATSPSYPICTSSTTQPACTPTTEICDSKDNDCDGQIDEGNVCSTNTSSNCFNNVNNIPSTCEGTISGDSMQGGCRIINCNSGSNSMQIKACDKPNDTAPQYFEMYRQTFTGIPLKTCIGDSCIKNEGYIKSQNYPICDGTSTPTPPPPTPSPNTTSTCFNNIQSIPSKCNGGTISEDTFSGCRTVVCGTGTSSLKILACNKPDGSIPQYFEMYKQNEAGTTQLEICLGNTCIKDNGYAKSSNYPICISSGGTTSGNSPPQAPQWLEPSQNKMDMDPVDFHLQVFDVVDAEGDTHIGTDFEIWDDILNQRVWATFPNNIANHVHNKDGFFHNSLDSSNQLLYDRNYRVRAMFHVDSSTNNFSDWSEWRFFKTKAQFFVQSNFSWTAKPGFKIERVAANVSFPVNIVMAPKLYSHLPQGEQPLLYFTQLYGQIGMIRKNGRYVRYADNLLNYFPGSLPGTGESGVVGIYADETTGDLFVSLVYMNSSNKLVGKVVRFYTNDQGTAYTNSITILDKIPVDFSHQVHTITRGPDGKLYMSTGDANSLGGAGLDKSKDPKAMSGKILRFNDDGTMPPDNPFPGTYTYAGGFRNPFGHTWKPGTSELFVTNNGPDSDDGVFKVKPGDIFGWCCNTAFGTWNLWKNTTAPTQLAFNPGISGFPQGTTGNLFVALSGPTYKTGPDKNGKRIVKFTLQPNGSVGTVEDFVVYTGTGYSAPIGLAFSDEGIYFTDIYGHLGIVSWPETRGNIFRVVAGTQTEDPDPANVFAAAIGPRPWYPKGLEMVWECKVTGGSGNFRYSFDFGDGQETGESTSNTVYHKYAAPGTYTAKCTVRDVTAGKSISASSTITLTN